MTTTGRRLPPSCGRPAATTARGCGRLLVRRARAGDDGGPAPGLGSLVEHGRHGTRHAVARRRSRLSRRRRPVGRDHAGIDAAGTRGGPRGRRLDGAPARNVRAARPARGRRLLRRGRRAGRPGPTGGEPPRGATPSDGVRGYPRQPPT